VGLRGNRTATLGDDAAFAAAGNLDGIDWQPIAADDPVRAAACTET
jgi:hypothetical protein